MNRIQKLGRDEVTPEIRRIFDKYLVVALISVLLIPVFAITVAAQDRLKSMPGYDQYEEFGEQMAGSVGLGTLNVTWTDDSTFEYNLDGKQFRYDISDRTAKVIGPAAPRGHSEIGR